MFEPKEVTISVLFIVTTSDRPVVLDEMIYKIMTLTISKIIVHYLS